MSQPSPERETQPFAMPRVTMPRTQHAKKRPSLILKILPVLAPTLVAALYYGLIATPRYVATASFVVRGTEAPKIDMVGALTGISGQAQSIEDSYILKEFLNSPDFLAGLRKTLPLDAMFRPDGADIFSRLHDDATLEELRDYWQRRVRLNVEKATGIVTLEANAFTPEDALKLATTVVSAGEERLNELSSRSRADTLKIAEEEMAGSIKTLAAVRHDLTAFRTQHAIIDPDKTAQARQGIADKLGEELVAKTVERASLLTYMQPSSPQVSALDKRIDSLKEMIAAENEKSLKMLMSQDLMDQYGQLTIDLEVAEKNYIAATQFLETARLDGLRQRRYLSVFAAPRLPEEATEPERLKGVATVFLFALLLWGIGQLVMATIREHRQWNL